MTSVNVLDEAEMLERAIAMSLEVNENCEEGHQSITQSESGACEPLYVCCLSHDFQQKGWMVQ